MRPKVSKSKNSASYYVTKTIYDNGVKKTITVEKLGTENFLREKLNGQDPYTWAKEHIRILNEKETQIKREIMVRYSPVKQIDRNVRFCLMAAISFFRIFTIV